MMPIRRDVRCTLPAERIRDWHSKARRSLISSTRFRFSFRLVSAKHATIAPHVAFVVQLQHAKDEFQTW